MVVGTRIEGEPIYEMRQVEVGRKPGTILLELPIEVARTLAMVVWRVGGCPNGRRGHIDQITNALQSTLGKDFPSSKQAEDAYGSYQRSGGIKFFDQA